MCLPGLVSLFSKSSQPPPLCNVLKINPWVYAAQNVDTDEALNVLDAFLLCYL